MGFGGHLFARAWHRATDLGRQGAAALMESAQPVGVRFAEEAQYVQQRSVELGLQIAQTSQRVAERAAVVADQAKEAAMIEARAVREAIAAKASTLYRHAVKTIRETAHATRVGVTRVKCRLEAEYRKARANARTHSELEPEFESELTLGGKLGPALEQGGEIEHKASFDVGVKRTAQWLRSGDKTNFMTVGYAEGKASVGYSYDPLEGQRSLDLVKLEGRASLLHGEGEKRLVNGTFQLKGEADVGLVAGALRPVSVDWGRDVGLSGEVGAEAVLARAKGQGALRVTPKTIYDDSLGAMVNLVSRGSSFAHLPSWADYGLALGVGGELGIGAAAKADYKIGHYDDMTGIQLEARLGAGPMAGLKGFLGVATPPEDDDEPEEKPSGGEGS